MGSRLHLGGVIRGESGSILVVAGIAIVVFALLGGAVLEVGQWFQHRRQLQVRADAAALAGGGLFNECFAGVMTANSDIENAGTQYRGIESGGVYNEGWQAGTSAPDAIGFQSNEFPTTAGAFPPRDAFLALDPNSNECASLEFDVKLKQGNLPDLLSIPSLATAKAWARVEEQTILAAKPSLPLAIPNFDLRRVGVTFVDETTGGNELSNCTGSVVVGGCTFALSKVACPPDPPGCVVNGEFVTEWSLPTAATINLPAPSADGDLIGVRVSTGSAVGSCANTAGTNSYACVDITQTGSGLVGIRDYPTSQTAPALYEVWPSDSCSSDSSPFFSDLTHVSTCTVTLQAKVDSGGGCAAGNPETSNPHATLIASMPQGNSITLHPLSCDANGRWLWQGTTTLPIDANSLQSEYPVTLNWTTKQSVNGTKSKTWSNIQRFTSGNLDDDGPVRMISLSGGSGLNPYSATAGSDTVGVTVVTSQAGITHQLVVLRGAHNGSSTAFILCYDGGSGSPYSPEQGDPGITDGMQNGCSFSYGINPTNTCPDPGGAMPLPADCVPNKPSASGGNPTVTKPLNARFGCSSNPPAYPDNWPNTSVPGDKRAVTLLLTSYNAYSNGGKQNGNQSYPVEGFGNFYITGFSADNCAGDEPPPPSAAADGNNSGDIWGYFIQYSLGGATPSGQKCKLNTFGSCTAALVR